MFYDPTVGINLRFGDVVKGYLSVIPRITKPFGSISMEIENPQFSVVLDPCCEIGSGTISLSPLEEVSPQLLDIPYMANDAEAKDLLLLNRQGIAKNFFHPVTWNKLSEDEKRIRLVETLEYVWKSYFIYEGNPLFPEYTIVRKKKYVEVIDPINQLPKYREEEQPTTFSLRHRMINLKTIYRVNCPSIVSPNKPTDYAILGSIVLQLSVATRNLLRQKMAYYFGKPPPEDTIET